MYCFDTTFQELPGNWETKVEFRPIQFKVVAIQQCIHGIPSSTVIAFADHKTPLFGKKLE